MGSEVNLNYIEPPKTLRYHLCAFVNKAEVILLYESYMIIQDRLGGPYMHLTVSIDVRFQRLRFCVRFFV